MSFFQAIYLVHGLAGYRGLSAQRLGAQLLVGLEFLGRSCPARPSIMVERPSPL